MIRPEFEKTFDGWRNAARILLQQSVPPAKINWSEEMPMLLGNLTPDIAPPPKIDQPLTVPPAFVDLAEAVAYARDPDRWELLYRILFRLRFENPDLMSILVDPDILRANHLKKSVRRDIHKMHAFVRFKRVDLEGEEVYVAWHRPEHLITRPGTPFFARRFGDRKWSIFTPEESAHWDLRELTFGPGMPQHEFDVKDDWDEVWKTYYKSIFNPARIKIKMMKAEMSPKYWSSMPETALIQELVREAPQRLQTMALNHNRAAQVLSDWSLAELKENSKSCTACPLFSRATQTVFGEGPEDARIMIVGEQPGDTEDREGKPFIGPAGEIFNEALLAAGLTRGQIYVTNAVKHFKWEERGKVRLHKKPSGSEMHACKPWLEAEIARVKPDIIVALGATAATAILGRLPKIGQERGKLILNINSAKTILTWHPSAILRADNPHQREAMLKEFRGDLSLARASLFT